MRGFRQWRWNVVEVFVKINGETHYLWRAVDHEGEVLESYVTKKRVKKAALRFFKKPLQRHGSPVEIVTDGLKSYPEALKELGIEDRRIVGRWENKREGERTFTSAQNGASNAASPAHEELAEIRFSSRQPPQSLRLRTPPRQQRNIQHSPLSCSG